MKDEVKKPTLLEALDYGAKSVEYWIRKCASTLPDEQKDEIRQEAALKLFKAYERMDPTRGLKAFCQQQVRGAVLDYIRDGVGFEESTLKQSEDDEMNGDRLRKRVEITDDDGKVLDVEHTAGVFGVYFGDEGPLFRPDWALLSRLAGEDDKLHLVCKILLQFKQEEIAAQYPHGITRERLSQQFYEFFEKLDDPIHLNNPVVNQTIFALGLCEFFHMPDVDNGYGWDLPAYNLLDPDSFKHVRDRKNPLIDPGIYDEMLKRSDIFGKYVVQQRPDLADGDEHLQMPLPFE